MGITPPSGGRFSKPLKKSDNARSKVGKKNTKGLLNRAKVLSASSETISITSSSGVAWDKSTPTLTSKASKALGMSSNLSVKAKSVPNLENVGATNLLQPVYNPLLMGLTAVLSDGEKWGNDIHFSNISADSPKKNLKIKPLKAIKKGEKFTTPELKKNILLALADVIVQDEKRLNEEGLFRLSGIKTVVDKSISQIEKKGAKAKLQNILLADITSIIKALLKDIASTTNLCESLLWFKANQFDYSNVPDQYKENVDFLIKLGVFLAKISSNSSNNKMNANNLVIVFGPNFTDLKKEVKVDFELLELIKHFEK